MRGRAEQKGYFGRSRMRRLAQVKDLAAGLNTESAMKRHDIVYENLKRLRDRQRRQWEPIPLQLPLDIPCWPSSEPQHEPIESDGERPGRVVIIDMNNYCEIEP